MKKRFLAMLLVGVMSVSVLAGCGKNEGKNGEAGSDSADLEPITFEFYNADGTEDLWNDPVAEAITKATGVTLETSYPVDGTDDMISMMISGNDYPDLIFAKGDGAALIEAGALIDLTELIDEYGPNIKKLYGDNYNRLKYSEEDPAIYQLCQAGVGNVAYTTSGTAQLQYAVLEANNYEIPYTLAQYEAQIKNYMKANPTIDGLDTIGLTISCSDWHWYITLANPAGFIANGSPDNGQWIIEDDNNYKATYKHAANGQKEYFQWLNRMYAEGILDKDFATQTHDDYIAKIASGRVLGILDANWDYADAEKVLEADGKEERTYACLPVTMNESIKCATLMDQGLSTGWGIGITTACKDPVRAIKFLDWICTDEAQVLLNWGIEGVNYFVDENGMRYRTAEEIGRANTDVDYKKETGVGFHNYPFPAYGSGVEDATGNTYTTSSKESVIETYNSAEKAAAKAWNVNLLTEIFPQPSEFKIPPYAAVWAQTLPAEFNEYAAILDEIAWPGLIECIICEPSEFDATWKKLQDELNANGRAEAEAMLSELIQKQVKFWSK